MNLYALVNVGKEELVPMIFCPTDIAEVFPDDGDSFIITLRDGKDYFCRRLGFSTKLFPNHDFSTAQVVTCEHDIYTDPFLEQLLKLRRHVDI